MTIQLKRDAMIGLRFLGLLPSLRHWHDNEYFEGIFPTSTNFLYRANWHTFWLAYGVHTGDLMGFPPTNKKVNFNTITILRFKNVKAVERWSLTNDMEVAGEFGII